MKLHNSDVQYTNISNVIADFFCRQSNNCINREKNYKHEKKIGNLISLIVAQYSFWGIEYLIIDIDKKNEHKKSSKKFMPFEIKIQKQYIALENH